MSGCFDETTEIILYSLDDLRQSVVAVHNGHVSGTKIGDPLTGFAVSRLKDKGNDAPPYYNQHPIYAKDKTPLRGNTYFILDKNGNPRAVLCINTDVSRYQKAAELLQSMAFLPSLSEAHTDTIELDRLQTTPRELILKYAIEVSGDPNVDPSRLSPAERMKVVEKLGDDNFFLMKGAVSQTALVLDSSEATIYRYLSKLHKKG